MLIGIETTTKRTKIVNLRDEQRAREWMSKTSNREVYEVQDRFKPSNNDIEALWSPGKKLSRNARMGILYRRFALRRLEG